MRMLYGELNERRQMEPRAGYEKEAKSRGRKDLQVIRIRWKLKKDFREKEMWKKL